MSRIGTDIIARAARAGGKLIRLAVPLAPALGLLLATTLPAGATEQGGVEEYAVKAAYIYNFTKFVQWPDDAAGAGQKEKSLNLYVLGDSPLAGRLPEINGRTVGGRELTVKNLKPGEIPADCMILVITDTRGAQLASLLKLASSRGILTIGDIEGFAEAGGMIGFYWQADKIRFAINNDAALKAGIVLSSQLLKLAKIVR